MSQTTDASCDWALGQQQTIAERNDEVDLSSIASPMAGIKQVIDSSYSVYGCIEWFYSAFVSKANTGLAGVSQTTTESYDLALGQQHIIVERGGLDLSSIVSLTNGIRQVIDSS